METVQRNLPAGERKTFSMKVGNRIFTDKKEAGSAILAMCKGMDSLQQAVEIGAYAGMTMKISFDSFNRKFVMSLKGDLSHSLNLVRMRLEISQGCTMSWMVWRGNFPKQRQNLTM